MAVQFILGRSGTGKTSLCIASIVDALARNEKAPLVLLVPEQATYQAERSILSSAQITGYSNLYVLSFERLSFLLRRSRLTGTELTRQGRTMLVHRILLENKDKLSLLGASAHIKGISEKLAALITQLHSFDQNPDDLKSLIEDLSHKNPNDLSALKFSDVTLIFEKYLEFIESNNNIINPDIQLTRACDAVADADFLKNSILWVDGFAGFTLQERNLLIQLLKTARRSHIAMCLDPDILTDPPSDDMDLFEPTQRSYTELIEIIKKCKLPIEEPIILQKRWRFADSPPLEYIERNLFSAKPTKKIDPCGAVNIVTAHDPRAEATNTAREIIRLVRNQNYRFGDIAVIASDLNSYQRYIEAAFADYSIPFFIDTPKSLARHPAVELLTSALSAALEGFATKDIITCLKTGFCPVDPDGIDELENYCLAFGIDGTDWLDEKKWNYANDDDPFDQARIDELRRYAVHPISSLAESLKNKNTITAQNFISSVWTFIEQINLAPTLEKWAQNDPSDNRLGHRQFFDKLIALLNEFAQIFADRKLKPQDYAAIFSESLSSLTLKLIPPTLDQVLVGSIERSRHPDLKAVFLIGTTQKQFPEPLSFTSLLTDSDRTAARSKGVDLGDTLAEKLNARVYLAYIAFTRPSQKLYISYPYNSADGSPVEPSPFLAQIKRLFTSLTETKALPQPTDPADICVADELTDLLCASLGKDRTENKSSYENLSSLLENFTSHNDPTLSDIARRVEFAVDYKNNAVLDEKTAAGLFEKNLFCSTSRLQSFASCPYQHFAKYALKLEERKLFTFEPVDLGSFYHAVLEKLFTLLKQQNTDMARTDDTNLIALCRQAVNELITHDKFISNFFNRSPHNAYIINSAADIILEMIPSLAQMTRAGLFRQKDAEIKFGFKDSPAKCLLKASDNRSIILRGIIDRIDCADINGKLAAVVFDYKSTERSFSFKHFYHGLDMQLLIYMLAMQNAAVEQKQIDTVAGAFYIPVQAAYEKTSADELKDSQPKFKNKAKGIFDAAFAGALDSTVQPGQRSEYYNFGILKKEQTPLANYNISAAVKTSDFQKVLNFAEQKIIDLANSIFAGRIGIAPYRLGSESPCKYCLYHPVCKFDWQMNEYNTLPALTKQQVLDTIGDAP